MTASVRRTMTVSLALLMLAAITLLTGHHPAQAAEKTVTAETEVGAVTDAELCASAADRDKCERIGDILEATLKVEVTADAGDDPSVSIRRCFPFDETGVVIRVEGVSAGAEVTAHLSGTALDLSSIDETVGPVVVDAGDSVEVSVCASANVDDRLIFI